MNTKFRKGVVLTPPDLPGSEWPERMKKLGLNTLGMHSGGGAAHNVLRMLGDTVSEKFRSDIQSLGIDVEYEDHASESLLPRELFATHPEYFIRTRRGNRREASGNWCISNPELRNILKSNAGNLAKKLIPTTGRHFFWGGDGHELYCHCEKCCELTQSDQCLMTANTILEGLRVNDPEAKTAFLAYFDTLEVPERILPAKGVFLEYAPYGRCYRHALDDPKCRTNAKHLKVLRELLTFFDPSEAHVLEYWLDSSWYGARDIPRHKVIFIPEVMERDIRLYSGLGIRSITTFAVYMDVEYFSEYGDEELRTYAEILSAYD